MSKGYRFRKCGFILSTGAVADMTVCNFGDAINAADNLLNMIVMEHFEEILKTQNQNGEDLTVEIIENEVKHLIDNNIKDHKEALRWFLEIFSLQRLLHITNEVNKKKNTGKYNIK